MDLLEYNLDFLKHANKVRNLTLFIVEGSHVQSILELAAGLGVVGQNGRCILSAQQLAQQRSHGQWIRLGALQQFAQTFVLRLDIRVPAEIFPSLVDIADSEGAGVFGHHNGTGAGTKGLLHSSG